MSQQVTSIHSAVKPSVEDVCIWLEAKAARGELSATTARLKCTAMRALLTPLSEDEPKDAEFVLKSIDDLTRRWATLNSQFKSDTSNTYASRARSALEDYFRWKSDPTTFKFREAPARTEKPREKVAAAEPTPKTETQPQQAPTPPPHAAGMRSLPLPGGREFVFALPSEVTVSEVRRIAAHLVTYANDWDATNPAEAASSLMKS